MKKILESGVCEDDCGDGVREISINGMLLEGSQDDDDDGV